MNRRDFFGYEEIRDPITIEDKFEEKKQGQDANIAGKLCEKAIEDAFSMRGVFVTTYTKTKNAMGDFFERRLLIKNVPFTSIYGSRSHTEFVYQHPGELRVRIECKSQQTPGSVDEKFPYMIQNAKLQMPEKFIWFVMEGIGARTKAITWFKEEASKTKDKKIRVFNVLEAQRAIKRLVEGGIP